MRVLHSRRHSSTSTTGRSSSASLSSALGSMRRGTRLKVRSRQQRRRPRCRIRSRPVPGRRPVRARWLPVPKGPRCQRTRPRPNESASLEGRRVPAVRPSCPWRLERPWDSARISSGHTDAAWSGLPPCHLLPSPHHYVRVCSLFSILRWLREENLTERVVSVLWTFVESGRLADSIFLSYLFYKVYSLVRRVVPFYAGPYTSIREHSFSHFAFRRAVEWEPGRVLR